MLHSGSRGVGHYIGTMFIELAKQDAMRHQANLPDRDMVDVVRTLKQVVCVKG